jgi:hypothetical protein
MRRVVAVAGWVVIGAVAAFVVVWVVAIIVAVHASPFGERALDIDDARACPHSNVELAEVTMHFGVGLPAEATGLRFSSDVHPWFGVYTMSVSFRTTPAGLRRLIADSGFSSPTPAAASEVSSPLDCPGPLTLGRGLMAQDDRRGSRTLVVDTSDSTRPLVYIHAADL